MGDKKRPSPSIQVLVSRRQRVISNDDDGVFDDSPLLEMGGFSPVMPARSIANTGGSGGDGSKGWGKVRKSVKGSKARNFANAAAAEMAAAPSPPRSNWGKVRSNVKKKKGKTESRKASLGDFADRAVAAPPFDDDLFL